MKLTELKERLYAADPAIVLAPARVLRGIIQREYQVPYLLVEVPHESCHVFDRQVVFREVEQDKLDLEPDRRLPESVILLVRPSQEELDDDDESLLLNYWRLLFHAKIDQALLNPNAAGGLSEAALRSRIEALGATEFEDIRAVLREENRLPTPDDDRRVYIEFCALYLELRYFAPNLRASFFPSLRNLAAVDAVLAQDVEAETLFRRTRLRGAPDPVVRTDTSSDESNDYYHRLLAQAVSYSKRGDDIRAAIIRTRAARVAPAALTQETRKLAHKDLERLTARLQSALKLEDQQAQEWLTVLPSLLEKADQGQWTIEARLLYDLQNVCVESERKTFALDLVEWIVSVGYRPIQRPLHSLQVVRVTKHLRSAAQRLTQARISDEDRQKLSELLRTAQEDSEHRLRERFRPVLTDALYDVGLSPANRPERAARSKLVEELLDRITEFGFFTFADLRDTLARNQLKMNDLADPYDFWRGDALLRLDRRLATAMDGVYRRGEFYLRLLERFSSLLFGTHAGRFLSLNLIIPFGGAFVLLAMVEMLVLPQISDSLTIYPKWGTLGLGLFILALMHSAELRTAMAWGWRALFRLLRFVLYEGPRRFLRHPLVRQIFESWTFLLFNWYVFKPLLLSAVVWWVWPVTFLRPELAVLVFLGALVALHSKYGLLITEAFSELLILTYSWLRFDLLRGLFRWTLYIFRKISDGFEYLMYTIDEWLRFSTGETWWRMAARVALGAAWFPFGYIIRFYFLTMIEPSVNPLKLPLSSLAAKFTYPLYLGLLNPWSEQGRALTAEIEEILGARLALAMMLLVIWPTLYLLPSVFAFFVWEMKGNWRTFRANRPKGLETIIISQDHGETLPMLLRPGFHSGTVPKLFTNLRRAEQLAYHTGQWRSARTYRQSLQEVVHSLRMFLERDFITLLRQLPAWDAEPISVGAIELAGNRIAASLLHARHPERPLKLSFDERSGWLLAGILVAGWLDEVDEDLRRHVLVALAGLYKLAGVNLIREQLAARMAPRHWPFDVTEDGLTFWPHGRGGPRIRYNLHSLRQELQPRSDSLELLQNAPLLPIRAINFSRQPLFWDTWVTFWDAEAEAKDAACAELLGNWSILPPRPATPPSTAARNGSTNGHLQRDQRSETMLRSGET